MLFEDPPGIRETKLKQENSLECFEEEIGFESEAFKLNDRKWKTKTSLKLKHIKDDISLSRLRESNCRT